MSAIVFDNESRQFSLIEDQNSYSLNPITGEPMTVKEYKKFMQEHTGLHNVKDIVAKGNRKAIRAKLSREASEHYKKGSKEMLKKYERKDVNKILGRHAAARISPFKKQLSSLQAQNKALKLGLAGAGVGAAAGAGYAIKKHLDARKAKKR